MHKATQTHTTPTPAPGNPPSRRLILSAFTGAAFAGMAVVAAPADAAENLDGELLAMAASFEDTARHYNGLWHWRVAGGHLEAASYIEDDDARERAAAPLEERMSDLAEQMAECPPATLAGCQAIARCLVLSAGDVRDAVQDGEEDIVSLGFSNTEWLLTLALLRGLGAAAISDENCAAGTMRFVSAGAA